MNKRSEPSTACAKRMAGASSVQQLEKDMRFIALILPLALVACTQFPELDGAVSDAGKDAKYPKLLPVDTLLAQSNSTGPSPEEAASTLSARLAALQNRAAQLRGSVVDSSTQKRMKDGVK
jgi:hypothetical protein|tara:strand:- start:404 stop:766 length:363 start_codon:yes stop_codon:yes gene_type:complete